MNNRATNRYKEMKAGKTAKKDYAIDALKESRTITIVHAHTVRK